MTLEHWRSLALSALIVVAWLAVEVWKWRNLWRISEDYGVAMRKIADDALEQNQRLLKQLDPTRLKPVETERRWRLN